MTLKYGLEPGGPQIVLTEQVISVLKSYRQLSHKDKEAGGQLFATFEQNNTIIVHASEPKPLDKRGRFSFVPNLFLQKMEIRSQYKKGRHYVGDWHSHPEPIPNPSNDDYRSMKNFFNKSNHEILSFLMVIAGTAAPPDCFSIRLVNNEKIQSLTLQRT